MKSIIYLVVLCCFVNWAQLQAQIAPPTSVDVYLSPIGTPTVSLFDTTAINLSNQNMKVEVVVSVTDITTIAKIHMKFGTTAGGSDLASHIFTNNPTQSVPLGWSFELEDNKYHLEIGDYIGLTTYYCEVQLEDSNGQLSTPVLYSSQ